MWNLGITMRNNLRRHFLQQNSVDIFNHIDFVQSNAIFNNYLKNLKQNGKGVVNHYSDIPADEVKKIVDSLSMELPEHLQLLIWFYITYFLARRDLENFDYMKKDLFEICYDGERHYIKPHDELTKNHRSVEGSSSKGIIYATDGNKCPVKAFEIYLSKLNPNCDFLFQKPKKNVTARDKLWYHNSKVGHNKISTFMPTISGLSKRNTNHCVRATTCTQLGSLGYSDIDIATISGHKSISSLSTYKRTQQVRKVEISKSLSAIAGLQQPPVSVTNLGNKQLDLPL